MKPGPALEPQAPVRGEPRAAEPEGRWRDKGEADTERQRTRERQEATLAGLAELEYLRQRQELLVRGALRGAGAAGAAVRGAGELPGEAAQRSRLEEKFLEENIMLLRKQLVGGSPEVGRPWPADLGWTRGCLWLRDKVMICPPPPRSVPPTLRFSAGFKADGPMRALCQV